MHRSMAKIFIKSVPGISGIRGFLSWINKKFGSESFVKRTRSHKIVLSLSIIFVFPVVAVYAINTYAGTNHSVERYSMLVISSMFFGFAIPFAVGFKTRPEFGQIAHEFMLATLLSAFFVPLIYLVDSMQGVQLGSWQWSGDGVIRWFYFCLAAISFFGGIFILLLGLVDFVFKFPSGRNGSGPPSHSTESIGVGTTTTIPEITPRASIGAVYDDADRDCKRYTESPNGERAQWVWRVRVTEPEGLERQNVIVRLDGVSPPYPDTRQALHPMSIGQIEGNEWDWEGTWQWKGDGSFTLRPKDTEYIDVLRQMWLKDAGPQESSLTLILQSTELPIERIPHELSILVVDREGPGIPQRFEFTIDDIGLVNFGNVASS